MRVILGRRVNARDERGATILVVVLALVAIFGMVVLVVDVGGALVIRQQMIKSADSASLAAALSFAKDDSKCSDPLTWPVAQAQADSFAADNGALQIIDYQLNCTDRTVTVGVESSSRQFLFAPIIGGPSSRFIHATATALWGPLGGGNAVPIVLDSGTLQGQCEVPDGIAEGDTCAFWYDNTDLGDASWGYMNLDLWDVPADANCFNAGASDRSQWIQDGYLGAVLSLNGPPDPTYVCVDTGHTARDWADLKAQEGEVKLFPVNDCNGQVDKDGNPAPCPATPDKYDIIGFTKLMILHVYQGDDPLAVGQFGTCTKNNESFLPNQSLDLDTFVGSGGGCPPTQPDSVLGSGVHLYPQRGPEYVQCLPNDLSPTCDYWYNATDHVVTWRKGSVRNVQLVFDWSIDAACPGRAPDPNAICLVTQWVGYQAGPGPVGGIDLGARGVRLLK